jgi:hypothetical protein
MHDLKALRDQIDALRDACVAAESSTSSDR